MKINNLLSIKFPVLLMLMLFMTSSIIQAQPNFWQGNGRIAISSDGNKHDNDDWGGTAMTLMIIAKAGLQDNLVLYTHSDHIWASEANDLNEMIESAEGGGNRFCFDNTNFIRAVSNPNNAYNAMRDAINASTSSNPLFILAAGPMQVIGEGLNRANLAARNHVTVIQHSVFNQFHSDGTNGTSRPGENHSGWNWNELVNAHPSVNWVKIVDQNGPGNTNRFNTQDIPGNDFQPWFWMRDHADPNVNWVYQRGIDLGRPDFSDAGMAYYLVRNGDTNGNSTKLQNWVGAGTVATCTPPGNNTVTITSSPASVTPGQSIVVNVDYESSGNNEVVAIVNSPTGTWLNNDVEPVPSGSGSITLTVTQPTNFPVANNYALEVLIRPLGTSYNDRFDLQTTTFNVVNGDPVAVNGVTVSPTIVSLTSVGATQQLSETISPANATNKNVSWSTNNAAVATVSTNGLVTAQSAGNAVVTVTTTDGNFTATSDVTVTISGPSTNLVQNPGLETGNINSWVGFGTRTVVSDAASGSNAIQVTGAASLVQIVNGLQANTTYTLSAQVKVQSGSSVLLGVKDYGGAETNNTINNTSYSLSSLTFTTGASNTSARIYFYVSGAGQVAFGDDFSVVGPGVGPVAVTGVTVSQTTVSLTSVGATQQLDETVSPAHATDKSVSWSTNNATVATVSTGGLVTAQSAGTAVITVTTSDGSFTATSNATVTISVPNTNLVQNPGLETGNINSWAGFGTRTVVSDAASGSNAIQVTGTASLVQVVSGLQANTTYTLSAQAKVQSGSTVLLGVKEYGGAETSNTISNTNYSLSSLTFTTGSNNTTAKIYFYVSGAGNVAFGDDFSVASSSGARISNSDLAASDASEVSVYPNPAAGILNIDGASAEDNISILDLSGRLIKSISNTSGDNLTIVISDLNNGIYLVSIGNEIIRLIKN